MGFAKYYEAFQSGFQDSYQHLLQHGKPNDDIGLADDEVIPDTQPEPESKRQGVRRKTVSWTSADETLLALAWVTISKNCEVRNSPKAYNFWKKILEFYNSRCSKPRKKDQVTSKWTDLNKKVRKFNGICNNIAANIASG